MHSNAHLRHLEIGRNRLSVFIQGDPPRQLSAGNFRKGDPRIEERRLEISQFRLNFPFLEGHNNARVFPVERQLADILSMVQGKIDEAIPIGNPLVDANGEIEPAPAKLGQGPFLQH